MKGPSNILIMAKTKVDAEFAGATIPPPMNMVATTSVDYLDPEAFVVNPPAHNLRAFGGGTADPEFKKLRDSIFERGVLQPVLYVKDDEGLPNLRVGFRRVAAVKELQAQYPGDPRFTTIPAVMLNGTNGSGETSINLLRANLAENAHRKDLTAMDHAHAIEQFRIAGLKDKDIAREFGYSPGWVSKRASLLNLDADLQQQVHAGILDSEAAYILSKKPVETQKAAAATVAEETNASQKTSDAGDAASDGTAASTRRKGKKAKGRKTKAVTRKTAKTAKVAKGTGKLKKAAKPKKLAKGARDRDDVHVFFSGIARDKEISAGMRKIAAAVVKFMDGGTAKAMLSALGGCK